MCEIKAKINNCNNNIWVTASIQSIPGFPGFYISIWRHIGLIVCFQLPLLPEKVIYWSWQGCWSCQGYIYQPVHKIGFCNFYSLFIFHFISNFYWIVPVAWLLSKYTY